MKASKPFTIALPSRFPLGGGGNEDGEEGLSY